MINVPQDSYVTIAEADAYHAIRPSATTWAALSEPEKEQRLVAASDYLDSQYIFNGKKTDENQPREFPRNGATEIPTAIKTYIETHFPSNTIVRAEKDTENNTITYEIYLNENINLEFDSASNIIDVDGVIQLPNSVIPQSILDYVSVNYPNNVITDWELEFNHQQVELNNNIELEFEMNGNFIRIDND